ncbi:hypothetical protein [Pseudoalteromonas rubra]|uniref:hypothetical protein n=1 Tax=Pseudoalteromonas rubra TaxID=43658 RepID=UPI001108071E|nr:hypothetical protein [Pseudoalteromonas rubra]
MQTSFHNHQFNNLLEWLCVDDKPVQHIKPVSAQALRTLLLALGQYRHIERRVFVNRLYQQQNAALLALIALCYVKRDQLHGVAPVRSVTQLLISWLLSPYEASSC